MVYVLFMKWNYQKKCMNIMYLSVMILNKYQYKNIIIIYNMENKHKNFTYLSPERQEELYPELSKAIGWNKCQRRKF